MRRDLDRRGFLTGLSVLGAGSLLASAPGARLSARGLLRDDADDGSPPLLVLLQLSGGNDGLSTVIPHGDDAYHSARRVTRHEEGWLPLDDYRGLHPELGGLHAAWEAGRLAIVEGVGYPQPNRSHFKSFDIWHAADPRGRAAGEGWVGRLCQALAPDEPHPNRVVHVGARPPYSLHSSRHPAASFAVPAGYRWLDNEDDVLAPEGPAPESSGSSALDRLRAVAHDARESSLAVRRAVARYRPRAEYPREPFADSLRVAAALAHGDIGARVISVELGGFDTHDGQRGRHDTLMRRLDAGLTAFDADLVGTGAGANTVVVAFSEFGRRVAENGSAGTDHGTAGPMFVLGDRVRGGLHGAPPSLTELDGGDLVHTTDFRSVYAALLEQHFEVDPAAVIAGEHEPLELLEPRAS